MAEQPPNGNGGYVRYQALVEVERRIREEWRQDLREQTARRDFQIAQMSDVMSGIADRTDRLEGYRDEQRGAWRLAIFLIGGNLLATVVLIVQLVR